MASERCAGVATPKLLLEAESPSGSRCKKLEEVLALSMRDAALLLHRSPGARDRAVTGSWVSTCRRWHPRPTHPPPAVLQRCSKQALVTRSPTTIKYDHCTP